MRKTDLQNNLAMTIVLLSGAMLFATLFMGYAIYRTSASQWPPLGIPKVSLLVPFLSTVIIVLSSWFAYQLRVCAQQGNMLKAHSNLNTTLLLGLCFMLAQSYLWFHMKSTGVFVGTSGIFGSILYGFTWIHAFHMVAGMTTLVYLKLVLKKGGPNVVQKSINVEKFWHFLGVVWIIMFLTLFVL